MIICVCEGVSDRTLRSAIRSGCRSVRALREATGAARDCCNCACDLKRLLSEPQEELSASAGPASPALLR